MKHFEELKIGATAALFCIVMLLVYAVFPKDGVVQTTKARMPEIPSSDSSYEEDPYGFQIYTEESNYDDSNWYGDSSDPSDGNTDTSEVYEDTDEDSSAGTEDPVTEDPGTDWEQPSEDSGDSYGEDTGNGDSYAEEPSTDDSYEEIYPDDTYSEETYQDDTTWNETEETYQFE